MQVRVFIFAFSLLFFAGMLTGCEKKESAVTLPPLGSGQPGSITMGNTYENQVFYDFEKNAVVATSTIASWDLAFEAAADGSHVYMNGGKGVFLYNTHVTDFGAVTDVPAGMTTSTYLFDDPSGNPDSTAMRDWRGPHGDSKKEIYIAKVAENNYFKFCVLSVNQDGYQVDWAPLTGLTPEQLTIPKNDVYNFAYFSFAKGLVTPEPPKAAWDVVFTRYRFIYRDMNNFPYEVNGVLLNPYKTTAAADSSADFNALSFANTSGLLLTTNRDVIGSDWKTYNFTTQHYDVNRKKCYILHTRNDKVYKLHFLDFYSASGEKGSPSFESQQIQ